MKKDGATPKKSKLKLILKILAIGAALLLIAMLIVLWQIDSIGRSAVESAASDALGVTTTLDEMNIAVFGGTCSWSGLTIGNPEGFKTPHFMKLDRGEVAVSLGTLMEDKIVFPKFHLEGLDINLEKSKEGANYEVILENASSGEKEEQETSDEPGKVFLIEEILITDIVVHADVDALIKNHITVKIPEIHITNLSSDDPSASLKPVMRKIIRAVMAAVLKTGLLPKEITQGLAAGLQGFGNLGKVGLEVYKGAGAEALTAGEGVLGGAAKKLGGLFGGSKKKKNDEDKK
ncbi:MAG: AsmA family protein [Planctomycetota bacterium]|nr:AsmA family protein [Planctomycetota bacterium]